MLAAEAFVSSRLLSLDCLPLSLFLLLCFAVAVLLGSRLPPVLFIFLHKFAALTPAA